MPPALRLAFAGTPEFAATVLARLIDAGRVPERVLTQPDRASGRGQRLTESPVKQLARTAGIEVRTPAGKRDPALPAALPAGLDVLIVAAYGIILPPAILEWPRFGCLNVHASLLPRWRGAAPVERAIMAGDERTGVSIMRMDEGLDTGPVLARASCAIGAEETGTELTRRLAVLGAESLIECLAKLRHATPTPQGEAGVSYAAKLTAGDSRVDWHASAASTARRIRALNDRQPVTVTLAGEQVKLLRAHLLDGDGGGQPPGTLVRATADGLDVACGAGTVLRITEVRLSRGKGRPMHVRDARHGSRDLFTAGRRFDDDR